MIADLNLLRKQSKRRNRFLFVILLAIISLIVGSFIWIFVLYKSIPLESEIENFKRKDSFLISDESGRNIIFPVNDEHRLSVDLSRISSRLKDAVITSEDDLFFQHKGLDYREIWNSFKQDVQKGKFERGASTITQQLARMMFLSRVKSIKRKIQEASIALEIERTLTKEEILELYLNTVHWGKGIYGAEAASRYYFDKNSSELSIAESVLLASILPNPKGRNLFVNIKRLKSLKLNILERMRISHKISQEDEKSAGEETIMLRNYQGSPVNIFPALDMVTDSRGRLKTKYTSLCLLLKRHTQDLPSQARTSIDFKLQEEAEELEMNVTAKMHNKAANLIVFYSEGESIKAILHFSGAQVPGQIVDLAARRGMSVKIISERELNLRKVISR